MGALPEVTQLVSQRYSQAQRTQDLCQCSGPPYCPRRHTEHCPHLSKNEGCVIFHVDQAILDGLH